MKVPVIIPSLNPDEKLMQVINGLVKIGFDDIIVVNDGSDAAHMRPFEEAASLPCVTILTHEVNRGKGRGLKTAFDYCIKNRPDIDGVVTTDGDNQHTAKDIMACAKKMVELKDQVILGVRDFSLEHVPWTSRAGNMITRSVFYIACGIKITDTQTGLRAIPSKYLQTMMEVQGERFEYETEMLLVMQKKNIKFTEVTIDTVYINDNETSHFNPFRDSFMIYKMIFKYTLSSFFAALVDFLVYSGILLLIGGDQERQIRLLIAVVGSRIVSSLVNFAVNKKSVFNNDAPVKGTLLRYYTLCILQLAASYGLVFLLSSIFESATAGEIFLKIPVDLLLFIISFQIQRRWVFKD